MNLKTDPTSITTCERAFFERHDMPIRFPVEPTSAISALMMCLIVACCSPFRLAPDMADTTPLEFWLAQAGTFLNGIGSFVFHSVHPDDYQTYGVNPRMLDAMALACMSVFTALLFVKPTGLYTRLSARAALIYLFFVAWSNDSLTFQVLYKYTNGLIAMAVQFPLMGLVYAYSITVACSSLPWPEVRPAISVLSAALLAWLVDRFLCDGIDALSFFHMFWHLFGTYGNILLMSLGLRFRGYDVHGRWMPQVFAEPLPGYFSMSAATYIAKDTTKDTTEEATKQQDNAHKIINKNNDYLYGQV